MTRICDHCGNEFTTSSTLAKYCPPPRPCRNEARSALGNRRYMERRFTDAALLAAVPIAASCMLLGAASAADELRHIQAPMHGASGRN